MQPVKIKTKDLQLGDIVSLGFNAYSCATVINVKEHEITLFRPYTHTSDFSYTSGVIPYIGFEKFDMYRGDTTVTLLEKGRDIK